jgi:pathogenesis-related protein 1
MLKRCGGMARRVDLIALACLAVAGVGMVGVVRAQDTGLTAAQRTELLQAHNRWRTRVRVPPLAWSNDLAQSAARWAAQLARNGVNGQCDLAHSDAPDVGENLYWLSPMRWSSGKTIVQEFSPAQVVEVWGRESDDYQYTSNSCQPGKTCGHYTQLVWKDTREVGCALRVCSAKDQVWVCQYRPAGNFVGEWPY